MFHPNTFRSLDPPLSPPIHCSDSPHTSVPQIDAKIAEKYMRPATVVMYGIDWPEVTARYGVLKTIQLKQVGDPGGCGGGGSVRRGLGCSG